MNFGKAIKAARKEKNISQKELSEKSGLCQSFFSQIEKGKKEPSVKALMDIAAALDMPMGLLYILGIDESDIPPEKIEMYKMLWPSINSLVMQIIK